LEQEKSHSIPAPDLYVHARVSRSLLCVASAGTGTGDGALCGLSAAPRLR